MLNIGRSTSYMRIYNPHVKNYSDTAVFAEGSSSQNKGKKGEEPNYVYSRWKVKFVGEALEPARALQHGTTIEIIKGGIDNQVKDGTLWHNVTVFEFKCLQKVEEAAEDETG